MHNTKTQKTGHQSFLHGSNDVSAGADGAFLGTNVLNVLPVTALCLLTEVVKILRACCAEASCCCISVDQLAEISICPAGVSIAHALLLSGNS